MFAADAAAKHEASLATDEDRRRFLSAARALLAADPEFSNRVRSRERTKLLSDDIDTPEMEPRITDELMGAIARLAREAVGTQRYLTEEELAHAIAAAPSPLREFIELVERAHDTGARRRSVERLTHFQGDRHRGRITADQDFFLFGVRMVMAVTIAKGLSPQRIIRPSSTRP
jgi:hypothetical protein